MGLNTYESHTCFAIVPSSQHLKSKAFCTICVISQSLHNLQVQRQALSLATKVSRVNCDITTQSMAAPIHCHKPSSILIDFNQSQMSAVSGFAVSQLRPPVARFYLSKASSKTSAPFAPPNACGLETLHLLLVNVLEDDF